MNKSSLKSWQEPLDVSFGWYPHRCRFEWFLDWRWRVEDLLRFRWYRTGMLNRMSIPRLVPLSLTAWGNVSFIFRELVIFSVELVTIMCAGSQTVSYRFYCRCGILLWRADWYYEHLRCTKYGRSPLTSGKKFQNTTCTVHATSTDATHDSFLVKINGNIDDEFAFLTYQQVADGLFRHTLTRLASTSSNRANHLPQFISPASSDSSRSLHQH